MAARRSKPSPVFALPVLPAADVFPMMEKAEFAELVEDIRQHGLREPLVTAIVDQNEEEDGKTVVRKVEVLVDGRNRRAACQEAGVEPTVRQLNGEDPTAFVLSANIHRRHMTKGQRAMAVAVIYPEAKIGGVREAGVKITPEEISKVYLSHARTVLKFTPEAVSVVMSGAISLDAAYQEAKAYRERAELESTKLEEAATKLAKRMAALKVRDEGLHDKVVDGEMTIKEAEAEATERERIRELRFGQLADGFNSAISSLASSFAHQSTVDELFAFLADAQRRRQMRKMAYQRGHLVQRKQAARGLELAQPIFTVLEETAGDDGTGDFDG